jgi:2-methylcitrate dehydratase PrpD
VQQGFAGPVNFLTGVYGFGHLYGRGTLDMQDPASVLGKDWRLTKTMFKKYPGCGATQGSTGLVLQLAAEWDCAPRR